MGLMWRSNYISLYIHIKMILNRIAYKRKLLCGLLIGCILTYICISIHFDDAMKEHYLHYLIKHDQMHQQHSPSLIYARKSNGNITLYKPNNLVDIQENYDTDKPVLKYGGDRKVILVFNPRGKETRIYDYCAYNNCMLTSDRKELATADAIIFEICKVDMGTRPPIDVYHRNPDQVWISKCCETPVHYPYNDYKSEYWKNTMNWSMTYRLDSDITQTWGMLKSRKEPVLSDYESIYNSKTKMALWAVSHCHAQSARDQYISDMIKYGIYVDIVGRCGPNKTHIELGNKIQEYKFYFAFENSICKDYITEKFFRKYNHNWILVVRGGADYHRLLPTNTYINTEDFVNASQLADHLLSLGNDKERYMDFLRKKDKYESIHNHSYKYASCELCRRLNNLPHFRNIYTNIRDHLESGQCRQPTDVKLV